MSNWTIHKEENAAGDWYAEVRLDGRLIMVTLWLGESNETLIGQAKAFKSVKGL